MSFATIINTQPGSYPLNHQAQVWHEHATKEAAEQDAQQARAQGHTAEVDEMVELAD